VGLLAPAAFGAGAGLWFAGPARPGSLALLALALGLAAAAFVVRTARSGGADRLQSARPLLSLVFAGAAFCVAGGCAAAARTASRMADQLAAPIGPVEVRGYVLAQDQGRRQPRFLISTAEIDGAPRVLKIRLSAPDGPGPGRAVRCLAHLAPPPPPLAPRAFDPQFRAFMQGLGAQGFALGRCRPDPDAAAPTGRLAADLALAALRRDMTDSIYDVAPGRGGAMAAALVTGEAGYVDQDTTRILRDSGLMHILSVSGMHMSMVAGIVFAIVAHLAALAPGIAARAPARKIAALCAIVACGAYLVISGASVPAQRAYVMTLVAFGAILADRPALSMRGLALAALIVLASLPESVLDPGFQMSFAATGALVAHFEGRRLRALTDAPAPAGRVGLVVRGIALLQAAIVADLAVSLVAGAATDPFVIYHFGRISVYGAAANLVGGPIVAFIVAPAAALAAFAAPLGLADWPLVIMASGLDLLIGVGAVFADREEAVIAVPLAPTSAILLAAVAMIWAMVFRGGLRWAALAPALLALGLQLFTPRPILWARNDLRVVMARTAQGEWRLIMPTRGGDFARDRLAGLAGLLERRAALLEAPTGCKAEQACTWRTPGGVRISWVSRSSDAAAACVRADVVLLAYPPVAGLDKPAVVGRCRARLITPGSDGRGGFALMDGRQGALLRARPGGFPPWASPPADQTLAKSPHTLPARAIRAAPARAARDNAE
jgi:competence protein ComEC